MRQPEGCSSEEKQSMVVHTLVRAETEVLVFCEHGLAQFTVHSYIIWETFASVNICIFLFVIAEILTELRLCSAVQFSYLPHCYLISSRIHDDQSIDAENLTYLGPKLSNDCLFMLLPHWHYCLLAMKYNEN